MVAMQVDFAFICDYAPPSGTESTGRIALRFDNGDFPNFGSYSIHVLIEGHEMSRIPLRVGQALPADNTN